MPGCHCNPQPSSLPALAFTSCAVKKDVFPVSRQQHVSGQKLEVLRRQTVEKGVRRGAPCAAPNLERRGDPREVTRSADAP